MSTIAARRTHPVRRLILRLQRTAGNRATAAAVQRRALTSGGVLTGYEFIVGRDVTVGFARAAKSSVRDGVVSPADLSALRAAGLAGDESVSDHEQLFMAGLLDPVNARALRSEAFRACGRHDHLRRRDRDGGAAGPGRGRRPSAGAGRGATPRSARPERPCGAGT